ncbi:sulfate transmembrane transporter [Actinidia rufa]|uniref:Sulfate transmembrane transporter n=1 Tax=Actinidia rufa TaxID=165716 RepID=A0A7J0H6E4_9ERIC|nr:sulfate transmembrane transporter [Actinidia rufa]
MEEEHHPPPLLQGQRWRHRLATNLRLKTTIWSELGGAVATSAPTCPSSLSLTLVSHLYLSTTLITTAVSETTHLSNSQIAATGISTAAILLLLGTTGLMSIFYRVIPLPVVRGIQVSQGLSFAFSAVKYVRNTQDLAVEKSGPPRSWLGLDGLIVALLYLSLFG